MTTALFCVIIFRVDPENGNDRLSRNVVKKFQHSLLDDLEERSSSWTVFFIDLSFWVVIFRVDLKLRPIGCPETSLRNYHHSLCNDPEERSSRLTVGSIDFSFSWKNCLYIYGFQNVNFHALIVQFLCKYDLIFISYLFYSTMATSNWKAPESDSNGSAVCITEWLA